MYASPVGLCAKQGCVGGCDAVWRQGDGAGMPAPYIGTTPSPHGHVQRVPASRTTIVRPSKGGSAGARHASPVGLCAKQGCVSDCDAVWRQGDGAGMPAPYVRTTPSPHGHVQRVPASRTTIVRPSKGGSAGARHASPVGLHAKQGCVGGCDAVWRQGDGAGMPAPYIRTTPCLHGRPSAAAVTLIGGRSFSNAPYIRNHPTSRPRADAEVRPRIANHHGEAGAARQPVTPVLSRRHVHAHGGATVGDSLYLNPASKRSHALAHAYEAE